MRRKQGAVAWMGLVSCMLAPMWVQAAGDADDHQVELKLRGVYWQDESLAYATSSNRNPRSNAYEQSALGGELNYKSPYFAGFVGVDASLYAVQRLGSSGVPTSNLLEVGNDGRLFDSYTALGQAFVKARLADTAEVRIGRQLQNSLLLRSTRTRAVPDTYSGMSGVLTPLAGLRVYGAYYDSWRPRSSAHFEKFRTESTAAGVASAIDYVALVGASYGSGPVSVTLEYLNSHNYLSKMGMVGAYSIGLEASTLKLSSGVFTSRDAGQLFVCGAERELDCTGTKRIENQGTGVYLDADWKRGNFTFGAAVAKFDGYWIEDNFATNGARTGSLIQDHGTNPFPTAAALGPDLSNNGETVGSLRVAYDWKAYVTGLRTAFKYAHGTGAKSSNLVNAARGNESYREFDVTYAVPAVKNMSVRYIYMGYESSIDGYATTATIKGMPRKEWDQHRLYVDYSYRF